MPGGQVLPATYYVTRHNEAIFTVLGSCVSACVRERKLGDRAGMNHFMLPLDRFGRHQRPGRKIAKLRDALWQRPPWSG